MIAPTPRAAALAAAGAAFAFLAAFAEPAWWLGGLAAAVGPLILIALDALAAPRAGAVTAEVDAPDTLPIGDTQVARVTAAGPRLTLRVRLETDDHLPPPAPAWLRAEPGRPATARFELTPLRRGEATLSRLWLDWTGPLGFARRRVIRRLDHRIAIVPNTGRARDIALRFAARRAYVGIKPQGRQGEGSELESLRAYASGYDPRSIDWKRSARHMDLVCREFRTERNHPVVLGLDCGRLMAERTDGAPRLDHAVVAAGALGWAALKSGDRVGLFAFDSRPRAYLAPTAGAGAFAHLQRAAAQIDYSAEETNFTLGLTELAARLDRRALVVVLTEFEDAVSAKLLVDNLGRLARRHLVLFVTTPNRALHRAIAAAPTRLPDAAKAVIADAMIADRAAVLSQLRRMGAECVEAPARATASAAVERYLALKREDRL